MSLGNLNKVIYLSVILTVTFFLLFVFDLFLGSVNIPFKAIFNILIGESEGVKRESWQIIVLNSRLPKALAAVLCGAALAVSGLKMQTLFRNPLAGPYILGISSGAGMGVAFFIMGLGIFGLSAYNLPLLANYGIITFSILGSILILLILLSAIIRLKDIMTVLILGIMIGSITTAITGVIQYFSNDAELKSFIIWTMGDLSSVTLTQLKVLAPVIIAGLLASFIISKKMNIYLLGEEYGRSLGLHIKGTQLTIILITAVLAGSVTAYCGPIGFIGIIIPHIARLLSNSSDHRILIPLSILLGMNVLLLADIISQLPGNDKVLPINSITSLIGIPFIIWIIFKNKRISSSI